MKVWQGWTLAAAMALGVTGRASAQDEDVRVVRGPEGPPAFFTLPVPPPEALAGEGPEVDQDFVVLFAHDGGESRDVKGAPYQAEAVTEITRHLADGNTIGRRTTSSVARDGEGRTRREGGLAALGPFPAGEKAPRHVFIHDPVAGVSYVLEPDEKVARKLPKPGELPPLPPPPGPGVPGLHGEGNVFFEKRIEKFEKGTHKGETTESLGTQTIEGVEAEGTRRRFSIPAGEIGNEKPIEVVSERWYSKELQTVVSSRHSDPRLGETTYRLTRLTRGEPDHALFEVPADYTLKEGPPGPRFRHRIIEEKQ
jgi:hypothetical protein